MSTLTQGAVVAALLTATVGAIGWFVGHHLQVRRADDERRAKAELEFLERQIEELYGPLSALLHEGRRSFEDFCASLGRTFVFVEGHELPEDELASWLYWIEVEALPRNQAIRDLLLNKAHLIQGSGFPPSYIAFFNHATSWAINHRRWRDQQVRYGWRSRVPWPVAFEQDVHRAFADLKQRHDQLLGRISAAR